MKTDPVIIIGMHRSGTTLLTQLLDKAGVFPGYKLDVDHEAFYFLRLNNWILSQTNSHWDNFYNYQFASDYLKSSITKNLVSNMSSLRRWEFLGFDKLLKYRNIVDIDIPWCWKDPRTTVTLNIWKEIFPASKIIFIYRNPIDVAQSLYVREKKLVDNYKNSTKKIKEMLLYHKGIYVHSARVTVFEEGVKLWEEYNQYALQYQHKYGKDFFSIKYEDFLEDPGTILNQTMDFIGVEKNASKIDNALKLINKERKYSFIKEKDLLSKYDIIRDNSVVKQLGYSSIV